MGRTITRLVALGVLPLGLAVLAYLTASELLSWPLFGARLWGVAVALLLIGIGNGLCERFLAAGDRKCQPHEVGRFLVRLISLHALAALSMAGGYMFAGRLSVGLLPHQWLCYVSALLGGSLSYLVFLWILFPGKDSHRAGRRMPREDELARAAKELERRLEGEEEAALFFAGHWLPFEVATSHFLVMGATNTGKTLIQRMLMQWR